MSRHRSGRHAQRRKNFHLPKAQTGAVVALTMVLSTLGVGAAAAEEHGDLGYDAPYATHAQVDPAPVVINGVTHYWNGATGTWINPHTGQEFHLDAGTGYYFTLDGYIWDAWTGAFVQTPAPPTPEPTPVYEAVPEPVAPVEAADEQTPPPFRS